MADVQTSGSACHAACKPGLTCLIPPFVPFLQSKAEQYALKPCLALPCLVHVQVGGYVVEYAKDLTFATVRNAGHM